LHERGILPPRQFHPLLELVQGRHDLQALAVLGLDGAQGAVPAGQEAAGQACGALGVAQLVADALEADLQDGSSCNEAVL
jgi:hypothetical protein